MFIDYTATRDLVGSGLDELDFDAEVINQVRDEKTSESVSLSGAVREYQFDRIDKKWTIQTVPISIADIPRWREFASSVANGELFTIDLFGTKAAPDNPISASYVKGTFKESRAYKQYITFAFDVLER